MRDWRSRDARGRAIAAEAIRGLAAAIGRYAPTPRSERSIRQTFAAKVTGDKPDQHFVEYAVSRENERAKNLAYSESGIAIVNNRIVEKFSIRKPSIAELLTPINLHTARRLPRATIVECETPYTYGDWVGEFLCALVCAPELTGPVILPAFLGKKSYVTRDLKRLGVEFLIADQPLLIEDASILRKRVPSYYWGQQEVEAYRRAFGIAPSAPREKSLLYLARYDYPSEVVNRKYPSEAVSEIVRSLGGVVFDTRGASPDAFERLSAEAETVIGDQGSALFGVLHWRTRSVIELTTRHWWHNSSLFFAIASGVENYGVIEIDDLDDALLRQRIETMLSEFRSID